MNDHYYTTSDAISKDELDDIDKIKLYESLTANINDFDPHSLSSSSLKIYPFTAGFGNTPFLLRFGSKEYVLRKCASIKSPMLTICDKQWNSQKLLRRQYDIMDILYRFTDVPVPKMYYFSTDSSIVGTAFYVMEFINGVVFRNTSHDLPTLSKTQRAAYFDEMARILSIIHSVDINAVIGLRDILENEQHSVYEHWNTANVHKRWEKMVGNAAETDSEIAHFNHSVHMECTRLKEIECEQLVHGDIHYENIIWDLSEMKILAVVDWEFASIGLGVMDLAHFGTVWELDLSKMENLKNAEDYRFVKGFNGVPPNQLGIPTQSQFMAKYIEYKGGDLENIQNIDFYVALDFWRLIGIFRWINESNPKGRLSAAYPQSILRYLARLGLTALQRSKSDSMWIESMLNFPIIFSFCIVLLAWCAVYGFSNALTDVSNSM